MAIVTLFCVGGGSTITGEISNGAITGTAAPSVGGTPAVIGIG
ncbi:hypothetical protein ACFQO7_07740 [Catellatospora aurea]|uniref:Uncharacterized protein n=1 Tax=Catellatospora aurea TaxID=1337874 RepID=A0ABW2GQQ6_9ACTN